jgi:hypothetical protein
MIDNIQMNRTAIDYSITPHTCQSIIKNFSLTKEFYEIEFYL